jgi:Arc/MetJ family transcription regulator
MGGCLYFVAEKGMLKLDRSYESVATLQEKNSMRTTVNVDDELFEELMNVSGAETKTEAVRTAIAEYVRQKRKRRLLAMRGKVNVEDNLEELRELDRLREDDDTDIDR